jgi:hypothetical protein
MPASCTHTQIQTQTHTQESGTQEEAGLRSQGQGTRRSGVEAKEPGRAATPLVPGSLLCAHSRLTKTKALGDSSTLCQSLHLHPPCSRGMHAITHSFSTSKQVCPPDNGRPGG